MQAAADAGTGRRAAASAGSTASGDPKAHADGEHRKRRTGSKRRPAGGTATVAARPAPGLYIVATPIGNARDITLRALDVLAGVDLIACEDTRVTRKLLTLHAIATPTVACHAHNEAAVAARLLERLRDGASIALVSDAGTPLVSDPGGRLVAAAIAAGLPVTALPGASAPLAALALAGLPTERVLFAGFLPSRGAERRRALGELAGIAATLVFLEAPHRLPEALADLAQMLGPRQAAVARELTKLFEEVRRASLPELAAHYAAAGPPKGEVVLLVGPPEAGSQLSAADAEGALDAALEAALGRVSLKQAVAEVAAASGRPRREVYARALALKAPP